MSLAHQAKQPPVSAGKFAAEHPPAAGGLEGASFKAREGPHHACPGGRTERSDRRGEVAQLGGVSLAELFGRDRAHG
eukprot:2768925-Alexandrium_andersonii.AAC.1